MDFLNNDPPDFDTGSPTNTDDQKGSSYPRSIVVGVILLAVLILVLTFWQLKSRLVLNIPTFGDGSTIEDLQQSLLEAEDEQLKLQDSDQDGLTDYQELRIYGSSPFIADSDSDGISDYQEIQEGSDPNCPQGQNCFTPGAAEDSTRIKPGVLGTEVEDQVQILQDLLSDPEQIREMLITGGANRDLVESLDDQTLQILAQQALASFSQTDETERAEVTSQIDIEKLRKEIVEKGVSKEVVDQLTDEELLGIYNQVFVEQQQKVLEGLNANN